MTFAFKRATRESVGLLIGLAGASGSGKTYSAMRLASGISGGKPFAVIDTEAGRAKHYADRFTFDHGDLTPPFEPKRYAEAIATADKAGYPVIVVDSFSHEHAGEGGLLDMFEAEYQRLGRKENVKMLAWVKPKTEHKRMVSRLLQVRAHLILCFRAEQKVEMVKNDRGTMEPVPKKTLSGFEDWIPICEKNLPYELTTSFLVSPARPGYPIPIKLQEQHRHLFPPDRPIDESSGEGIAEWAKGGSTQPAGGPTQKEDPGGATTSTASAGRLSEEQLNEIRALHRDLIRAVKDGPVPSEKAIASTYGCERLEDVAREHSREIIGKLEKLIPRGDS